MRIFFMSFTFLLTLIVAALAFVATVIEFPGVMLQLTGWANQLSPYLAKLGVSNNYLVWVDILLNGQKLVLLGYVLVTRIIFALLGIVFGPLFGFGGERPARDSAFHRWG
jgi:hypothetical protein